MSVLEKEEVQSVELDSNLPILRKGPTKGIQSSDFLDGRRSVAIP